MHVAAPSGTRSDSYHGSHVLPTVIMADPPSTGFGVDLPDCASDRRMQA